MKRDNSKLTLKPLVGLALVAGLQVTAQARPQEDDTTAVEKVHAIFKAADQNKDGRVAPREAARNSIRGADFASFDYDADRTWNQDEFFLYYRSLLTRAGHKVDAAIQAESNRILAERKAAREKAEKEAADRAAAELAKAEAAKAEAAKQEAAKADAAKTASTDAQPTKGAEAAGGAVVAQSGSDASKEAAPETLREKHDAAQEALKERFDGAEGADAELARQESQRLLERAQNAQASKQGGQPATPQTTGAATAQATPAQPANGAQASGAPASTPTNTPAAAGSDAVASVPVTPEVAVESGDAQGVSRDDAQQHLERSLALLKKMVDQGRLTPRQARDFYAIFKARATTLVEGVEPTQETSAKGDATAEGVDASQPRSVQLRASLANASRRLYVLHLSGALTAEEARDMQKQLEERAIAALDAEGDPLTPEELKKIRAERSQPEKPADATGRDASKNDAKSQRKQTGELKAGAVESQPKAVAPRSARPNQDAERKPKSEGDVSEPKAQRTKPDPAGAKPKQGDAKSGQAGAKPERGGAKSGDAKSGDSGADEAKPKTRDGQTRPAGAKRGSGNANGASRTQPAKKKRGGR